MNTRIGTRYEVRGVRGRTIAALAAIVGILTFVTPLVAHAGDAQQALLWLESTQRPEGSWCGANAALCERDTAEVLTTLLSVAPGLPQVGRGVSYIQNVVTDDPYLLGRKLSVGRLTGYVLSDDVQKLYALKTAAGGFAPPSGSTNTELHRTISALQFLSQYDLVSAGGAASNIISKQNPDGSWGTPGDVATTAMAITALGLVQGVVNASAAIQGGLDYIVAHANPDGSMGSGSDPLLDTVWGVYAIQSTVGEIGTTVSGGISYLTAHLDGQSSLEAEPYLTALFVRMVGQRDLQPAASSTVRS